MNTSSTTPPGERDAQFMRRALALAERGWGRTAPNPMVGAVVVQAGQIVGEGWHEEYGGPHAEVMALRAAGELARGATVYVSLEPCSHHGLTPPCTEALRAAGVARVVAAMHDPHERARGGAEILRAAGVEVQVGLEEAGARELNAPFLHALRAPRPFVTLKLALSLDGALADATRRMAWLTGPEARAEVHRLRAGADAVAVGLGTVLADDPVLTVREAPAGLLPRVAPRRVIFDRELRTPIRAQLVTGAGVVPTTIVHGRSPDAATRDRAQALHEAGVELLPAAGVGDGLHGLRASGVRHLLVEGGAGLAGALLEAGVVDRLIIFQAPLVLGGGALNAFSAVSGRTVAGAIRWRVVRRATFGPDLMTVYAPASETGD